MPVWKSEDKKHVYDMFLISNLDDMVPAQKEAAINKEAALQKDDSEKLSEKAVIQKYAAEMVKNIVDDYPRYGDDLFTEKIKADLEAGAKRVNPDYRPLTPEESKERRAASEKLQAAYTGFMATYQINTNPPIFPSGDYRHLKALLYIGTDPETFKKNEELTKKLLGTPEERKEAIRNRIHEIAQNDLGKIDLRNAQSLADHIKEIGETMMVGPELDKFVQYFTEPEDQVLWNKMNEIFDAASQLRFTLNICASPVYSMVRTEDLSAMMDMDDMKPDAAHDYILTDESGAEKNQMDLFNTIFLNMGSMNGLYGNSILADSKMTPQERSETYLKTFWDKEREDPEYGGAKPLPIKDTNSEWFRTVQEEANKLQIKMPELKQKLQDNINLLKETDPEFDITQQQIDEMFTPDRIYKSAQMRAFLKLQNQVGHRLESGILPLNMQRMTHAFTDIMATDDQLKEQNFKDFLLTMSDDSQKGQKERQEMVIRQFNKIKDLDGTKIEDPDVLSGRKPLASMVPFLLENGNTLAFGFESPNFINGMEKDLGLKFANAGQKKIFEEKGQVLGSEANQLMKLIGDDVFFTIPFDHMSRDLEMKLFADHNITEKMGGPTASNCISMQFMMKDAYENKVSSYVKEPLDYLKTDTLVYGSKIPKMNSFLEHDTLKMRPEAQLENSLKELQKQLEEQDKWYNLNNSKHFKEMKKALDQSIKMVEQNAQKGLPIDIPMLKDLDTKIGDYQNHARNNGDGPKNERQKARLNIAIQIRETVAIYENEKDTEAVEASLDKLVTEKRREEINANPEMQLFEKGVKRTDEMYKAVEGKTGSEKALLSNMIEARNELANQSGRQEPNQEIVGREMAKIIAAQLLMMQKDQLDAKTGQNPDAFDRLFQKTEKMVAQSATLKEMTRNMTGHDINEFLAGTGEKEMTKQFITGYRKESADRTVEISAKPAMKKGKEMVGEAKASAPKTREAGF